MKRINTLEEVVSLLKQRKKVYLTKEKENGYYTLIENCVSFCDSGGNILEFNTNITSADLPLYTKEDSIKFEWGKFYKTAKGEKALYYAEHKDDKGDPLYFFCVDKCEEFRTNALGKDIDFDNDIVDYWGNKMRKNTIYLTTVEDFTKALKDGKTVYAMDEFCNGESKLELINNILVRKDPDGDIIIGGDIMFSRGNVFYIKEKEPLKMEVGKFYKTRGGRKAICLQNDECLCHFYVFNESQGFYTTMDGKFCLKKESELDIVDYWED